MRMPSRRVAMLLIGLGAVLLPNLSCADVYRMKIQSHVSVGAKCIDVPYARFFPGMTVHMWDCNNGDAQTFVYDDQTLEVKAGSMCLTAWGRGGDTQDPVGIDTCSGGANQHWKAVAVGDYYQMVSVKDLCLNLRWANKNPGARLQLYTCKPDDVADLWALIEAK